MLIYQFAHRSESVQCDRMDVLAYILYNRRVQSLDLGFYCVCTMCQQKLPLSNLIPYIHLMPLIRSSLAGLVHMYMADSKGR